MARHTLLRPLLALLLLVLPASAQGTFSYQGVTHAGHQAHFDNLSNQGFRMLSLAVSGDYDDARYSAVWRQVGGPSWVSLHGMTLSQYQQQAATWDDQGFRAQLVGASGTGSNAVFAAVWISDGADVVHYHNTTLSSSVLELQRDQGRRLTDCAPYTDSNGIRRYAAVFEPNTQEVAWGVELGDDSASFGHKFNEFGLGHARPTRIATQTGGIYTHVWQDDRVGDWTAVAGRTETQFNADKVLFEGQGLTLVAIAAYGTGSSARYGGIFQEQIHPDGRYFTRTGQVVPEMAPFDEYVEDMMEDHKIRNASIAVARHGRLIYARGYTYAEPGAFITQPTTPFRLGSISKPLTGTVIHELIERNIGGFGMGTNVIDYLGITNHDAGAGNATVRRLLRHVSGISDNFSEAQARSWHITNNNPTIVIMPLDESIIVRYAATLPFQPIDTHRYSNVGFTALGQVIEHATDQSYMNALRDRLFEPVGTSALHQQRPRPEDDAPGEAPYFLREVTLEPSNLYSDWRLLANQYAREYWDSAGGTVSSAVHLARVVSGAYCIGDASPSLLPGAREDALEHFTYDNADAETVQITNAGWYWNDMGNGRFRYTHDGATHGFGARVVFTTDGLCIVLLTNKTSYTSTGGTLVAKADEVTSWPDHDLFPNYGMPTFPNELELGTAYCFGDGSGTPCPCGNTGDPGHGCGNRVFDQGAELTAEGVSTSVSSDTVTLRVQRSAPGQPGLFLQGNNAMNGGMGFVFGDGLRCAGDNVVRLQTRTATILGTTSTTIPLAATGGVSAGQTRRYQWWYRDPGLSPCNAQFNLSNGVQLTWTP